MAKSEAKTVAEYLGSLPADRKKAIAKLRTVVRKSLPKGIKEQMNWGMISYEVPLSTYPDTYNGKPLMFAAIASQKNHMALYLTFLYMNKKDEAEFRSRYESTGKKLDMGKSCLRFKSLDDLALDVIAHQISSYTLKKFIAGCEAVHKR